MNKREVIKAMVAAGISGEVSGAGTRWEVEVPDEAAMNRFQEKVVPTNGFKTGYGSWVLSPNHKCDEFDFNNPASRHHR